MKHYYQHIQGWCSFVRPYYDEAIARAANGAVFVEIGAWKGKSTAYMCVEIINSGKEINFHVVDTFEGSDEPAHHNDQDIIDGTLHETFCRNLAPVKGKLPLFIHRGDSVKAADEFEDNSVDFLLVDGDHTYEGVTRDLDAWWPKLKQGSIVVGDDWRWKSVRNAVQDFFESFDINVSPNGKHWWMKKC